MENRTPPPRRLDNGAIDLDFYVRRAHRMRSDAAHDRIEAGRRFFHPARSPER